MALTQVDFGGSGLVFVPTIVPAGMTAESDSRFVGPRNADRWMSVSRAMRRDVAVTGVEEQLRGLDVWFTENADRRTAVVVADTEWRVIVDAAGVSQEELRASVDSIPVLAQRDRFAGGDGRPITGTVSPAVLATWLESEAEFQMMEGTQIEPLVPGGHHQDVVAMAGGVGSGGTLLAILNGTANPLAELAVGIPSGRLYDLDGLPLVAGSDPEAGRAHVIWSQRDRFWHLMRLGSVDTLLHLAERIAGKVAAID